MNGARYIVASFACVIFIAAVITLGPVAQDPAYHQFIDQRTLFSIPHFWNVISNIPFLLVGFYGLYSLLKHDMKLIADLKLAYFVFFTGVFLTALGSGYYHLSPSNDTLLWDRLPMTLAFMALFSIIIGEFISAKLARLLLWPLIALGLFSVYYWLYTETQGEGDLRLYIIVQFLPVFLIPVFLLTLESTFSKIKGYWYLVAAYVLAKLFEYFDFAVYENFVLSGHSIKHVVAAIGIYYLLQSYTKRKAVI